MLFLGHGARDLWVSVMVVLHEFHDELARVW